MIYRYSNRYQSPDPVQRARDELVDAQRARRRARWEWLACIVAFAGLAAVPLSAFVFAVVNWHMLNRDDLFVVFVMWGVMGGVLSLGIGGIWASGLRPGSGYDEDSYTTIVENLVDAERKVRDAEAEAAAEALAQMQETVENWRLPDPTPDD